MGKFTLLKNFGELELTSSERSEHSVKVLSNISGNFISLKGH